MKRRLAPALIAMSLSGALAAQAQAQPHGSALGVASGKAAIDRLAGRLTYEFASGRSTTPTSWQVFACAKHGSAAICTGEWIFAGEKCSVRMQALKAGRSIRVRELGKLVCSSEGHAESAVAPAQ
jgi:hypothetical protein